MVGRCTASANRLGIAVVVLVPLEEWLHVWRRDQTNIVSKRGPAGGRCNELQSRLPCRSSNSECWQAGAQVERGSPSVQNDCPALIEAVPTAVDGADLCDMGRALCASQSPARLYVLQGGSTAGPSH